MPSGPPRRAAARTIGLLAFLAPAWALGQATQPRGALDRLDPSPAGDAFFSQPSADVAGRLRLSASILTSYAHDPLVLRRMSGGDPALWVRDQAVMHVQIGVEALKRFKLDLDVPVTLAEGGSSGKLGNVSVPVPSGAGVDDLRLSLRGALLHQRGFVPAAAIAFSLWMPSGNATSFTGAGVIRYQPGVVIGAEYTHFLWTASVGARFQPETAGALIGSQIVGGAGAAVRWFGLTVGPEAFFAADLGDHRDMLVGKTTGTNAELLLAARYRIGPVLVGAGGGPGLGRGPGTPAYRLFASLGGSFDVLSPIEPGDGDGADPRGARDQGARQKPPAPAAPPLDSDGDGVPDAEDACPTIVGDATPGAYRRGCPPDRDRDGIFDVDDRCPDEPGVESADPAKNGCPPDSDGDGIPDAKDACPHEKGEPSADPKLNGCPTKVRVEGSQIIILQQVNFETGRDEIKRDSDALLAQIAEVFAQHPEIARVAVDGHTDNRGGDKPNVNLSERRAIAVVRWLVEHGVDARRLEARGFGARRPIADNTTDAGRAKNRRVEFQIRRRTPDGPAGWRDGPVDEGTPK
jgi:outer membrane protein OmpA-like peptidoglycan-associated protein